MSNPFLTLSEIKEVFRNLNLEGQYSFFEHDLVVLAEAYIKAAMPAIIRHEREMCINYVRSLNGPVADKLQERRGPL